MAPFIIRFLPVIIFLIILLVWYLLTRRKKEENISTRPPWFVFIIIAIILFGIILVLFRFVQFGEEPGGIYIPPKLTEEGIIPGHVKR
ncbi:MAG: hypothetical protein P8L69_02715 [Alphaproteobacteria bacterium]|jgi:heme/copper-type cytochrome/quinol oxidase subunit 4|nr:hypothetical protein [Alphaproteobacteria bacterium]|tara:strand:+ start:330 stop:593 length:264 start_codon:yes stop_codon:yes gene_type:complete